MDSVELVKNCMKHVTTIDAMSKQVKFKQRQCLRLSKRLTVLSSNLECVLNRDLNNVEVKTMLQNFNGTLQQIVKLMQKFLDASLFECHMKNFEHQERLRMFNDLLMCNSADLDLPLDIYQLFDEIDDLTDQYADLNEVSSNIDELASKMAQQHKESFHVFKFTKEEFYRHIDSFKFHLQQDIQKIRDPETERKIENERKFFLHIPGHDLLQQERIGQGGFADVYRGKWLSRHHDVAIKVIRVHNITDIVKQDFLKEIATVYQIRYEHGISVLGACLESNYYALIMEYMPLGSLFDLLQKKEEPLSWSIRWSLALQMAKGINYLHMMSILHRDIKSSNFLIGRAPNGYLVKVADFSLAQIRSESTRQSLYNTGGKMPLGTLRWTAPELFTGIKPSMASDVYSLGIAFWEVATRCIPYEDTNDTIIMNTVTAGNRPPISTDVPSIFAIIISDAWNQNPHRRPICRELIQRLEKHVSLLQFERPTRPYPTTDANGVFQMLVPQPTNNILSQPKTSPASYGWKKELIDAAENEDRHSLAISSESVDRATANRETINLQPVDRHWVMIAIHDLMLYDNCSIYDDDDYGNIFISINFLNYPLEELETPESLPKNQPFTAYSFNFQKNYSVHDPEHQAQLAQLVAPESSGEIRFDIIAEPCDNKPTLECIDVGYAAVDVKRLLQTDSDCIRQSVDVISANKKTQIIGQMSVTVVIVQALKLAQQQISEDTSRTKPRYSVTCSQLPSSHVLTNVNDNNEFQDTENDLLALYAKLMVNNENEARPTSRCHSSVSQVAVSDSSNRASRLRLAAAQARINKNSNPHRHRAGAKKKQSRPGTPGHPK